MAKLLRRGPTTEPRRLRILRRLSFLLVGSSRKVRKREADRLSGTPAAEAEEEAETEGFPPSSWGEFYGGLGRARVRDNFRMRCSILTGCEGMRPSLGFGRK